MKWFAKQLGDGARGLENPCPSLDSHHALQNYPAMQHAGPVMKPMRWVAHLPLVILPLLAASAIEGPFLRATLSREVTASLAAG